MRQGAWIDSVGGQADDRRPRRAGRPHCQECCLSHCRSLLAVLLAAVSAAAQDDVGGWLAELRRKNDDADPALIQKIASARTKAAAEGLLRLYDSMASIYMQREILRALAQFDGVAEVQGPVLEKMANVAGSTEDPELREAALQGIEGNRNGRGILKRLVDSEAPESVREQALKAHVKGATAEDVNWYRHLWNPRNEQRKNPDKTIQAAEQSSIRLLAFHGLAAQLSEQDLIDAVKATVMDAKIRRAALLAMRDRKMGKTAEMAQWVLERVDVPGTNRVEAAKILVDLEGPKAVNVFLELAKKRDVTTDDLREQMAMLIATMKDEATNKRVARLIGKGKPHEQVFAMLANAGNSDPKVVEAIRKELGDKEAEIRREAAMVLGQRKDRASLPELRKLLTAPKAPEDQRAAIEAITAIEGNDPAWLQELLAMAGNADRDVRNAALEQLALAKDAKFLPALMAGLDHADWSTRLVAIDGVVALRDRQAVPKLIARLKDERGRMAKLVAGALWKLTAQPFDEDHAKWQAWWTAEGEKFQVVQPSDLEKAEKERELRRLRQRTRASARFFGLKVESHRVIFILDVSGSMLESVYGRYVGKHGAARIDVAKQELTQAIKNMDQDAQFNILVFSSGVAAWNEKGLSGNTEEKRKEALTFVERLGASGGTNLYDSVKMAFENKDVDTIFIMSDGEPTAGEVIDPSKIRENVAHWNEHRHVKINTIAVGGTFEVLEWLALDSGGSHIRIR